MSSSLPFDVHDQNSWYFGNITREKATEILNNEREGGVFLVRDSTTIIGDYVLCVREDSKVSHYIINKIEQNGQTYFRIGDQSFSNLPELLSFYKLHYLDTTPLSRPAAKRLLHNTESHNHHFHHHHHQHQQAPQQQQQQQSQALHMHDNGGLHHQHVPPTSSMRCIERVIGKYDFEGSGDSDDLPFRRNEILYIISKEEEQWWTARNEMGQTGQIPVPYVQLLEDSATNIMESGNVSGPVVGSAPSVNNRCNSERRINLNRPLPAYARVKQARVPNAYDKTALKFEIGDIIKVTKTNINGQWEGELNGRIGHFPFTHVEFIDDEPENNGGCNQGDKWVD